MAKRYEALRRQKLSTVEIEENDQWAGQEALELDLREMREALGKSQAEVADVVKMSQSEVSRLERRGDHHVSTLRRVVEALGGELEIVATFGNRRIRLRAAG
jgi:predicted transcriptional regulator